MNQPHRRLMLHGLAGAIALPWLESVTRAAAALGTPLRPASARAMTAAASGAPPTRMAFFFLPNGVDYEDWHPRQAAVADAALPISPTLAPLQSMRSRITVIAGLNHHNAKALGDGPGDHARSAACFLTGAHPRKTAGSDIHAGVSVDQVAARTLGLETPLPSLELGLEASPRSGNCDSGYSCAYSGNIAWAAPDRPLPKLVRPRAAFERLFMMSGATPQERQRRLALRKSILDLAGDEVKRLGKAVSGNDRERLDQYLESIRAVERRIEAAERAPKNRDLPAVETIPSDAPRDFSTHAQMLAEIMVLAFKTDQTRVATFMLGNEGSNRTFPELGISEAHHHLTHHSGDATMIDSVRRINLHQSEFLATVLARMSKEREGSTSLLDHTIIVYAGAISDGNRHDHDSLPVLVAGGEAAGLRHSGIAAIQGGEPMCNLYVNLLRRAGVSCDRFGDSTGECTVLGRA
ncbi:MAG: DUF1552 domain-containing protein [Planctomycetota bacterium]|nr:DUF1552 domain-containing protein [Planctomycetota bacterium]MDA1106250.1 DUF1552 domain-containing protein [Planctomycetota bacterium]